MRATIEANRRQVRVNLRLDPEDDLDGLGQQGMPLSLLTDSWSIELDGQSLDAHPDLLALATLTVLQPWTKKRLSISSGVSRHFADVVSNTLMIEVGPVDEFLNPRKPGSRYGLMFSGGPDCMAAEKLIGEKLPLFHFRRVRHPRVPNRATHFRSDVQEAIVRRAQERGEELVVARSNLEHLARPFPTFPHWTAVTVGAVVLAEALDIGGIVTGRNISGIYLGWGTRFRSEGEQEESWGRVFASAGLPLIQPLAGASDITSKRIAEDHRLIDLARSCARGTLKGPCLKCKKCVLTEVMQAVIEGSVLPDEYNHSFASTPSLVKRFGSDPPYPNQHLLEYSIARMPHVETTFLANAARHLKPSLQRTSWVERYFRPALDAHVPEQLIPRVSNRIEQHASFMNSHDEDQLRTWSAEVNALGDVE